MMFFSSFGAARQASEMVRTMQQLNGSAARFMELIQLLEALSEKKSAEMEANFTLDPDLIAFKDVTVVTPKGVTLVTGLSFEIPKGGSLLLTGHSESR